MKLSARSAAWLLPLLLTGFPHKTKVAQNQPLPPPMEDAQAAKPEPSPTHLAPPEVTISEQPHPQQQISPPPEPVKKPQKHKKPANTNTQVASATTPASVPAIGNLTTNDTPNLRQATDTLLEQTEKSLKGMSRPLNDQEQKTAAQIREFIRQARDAMTSGDVDGAHTLATKAKVLLDELHP